MPLTLAELLDRMQLDPGLADIAELWDDDQLTCCIRETLQRLSHIVPHTEQAALALTEASRLLDISSLGADARVFAVVYPYQATAPLYPEPLIRWERRGESLLLQLPEPPAAGESALICYDAPQRIAGLDGASDGTLNALLETALLVGIRADALSKALASAPNRVTVHRPLAYYRAAYLDAAGRFHQLLESLHHEQRMLASGTIIWEGEI